MQPVNKPAEAITETTTKVPFRIEDMEVSTRNRYLELEMRERELDMLTAEAEMFAVSSIVPDTFKKNQPNCAIALNMAKRIGVDPLMVMQHLYVVKGKPAWSAQFLIAAFNAGGKYGPIQYLFSGTGDAYGCIAFAVARDGTRVEGPKVTMAMVKGEGWLSNTKWVNMPDVMFRYRSASFLVKTVAPEITMGFTTQDEAEEMAAVPYEYFVQEGVPEADTQPVAPRRKSDSVKKVDEAPAPPAAEQTQVPVVLVASKPAETVKPTPANDMDPKKVKPLPATLQELATLKGSSMKEGAWWSIMGNAGYTSLEEIPTQQEALMLLGIMKERVKAP